MFKKFMLSVGFATLVFTFGAFSAEDTFSMPETDGGRADVVDQPDLSEGGATSREFAMPESDEGNEAVVDQPSLTAGNAGESRSEALENAFPVYD